ncbi:hypothetical protein, partial [uncultured Alistipes sp.]|uniref:hypothetical protein n=1 Tax=uncultured Alistipes sp. TaxID=538949 RepID=UPI0026107528
FRQRAGFLRRFLPEQKAPESRSRRLRQPAATWRGGLLVSPEGSPAPPLAAGCKRTPPRLLAGRWLRPEKEKSRTRLRTERKRKYTDLKLK